MILSDILTRLIGVRVLVVTNYGHFCGVLEKYNSFRVRQENSYIEFSKSEVERIYFKELWTLKLK